MVVYNFDSSFLKRDVDFRIVFGPAGLFSADCPSCTNGEAQRPNSCICQHCESGYTGLLCSRKINEIQSQSIEFDISSSSQKFFSLHSGIVETSLSIDSGIAEVYIQIKSFQDEAASFFNVAQGLKTEGRFTLIGGNEPVVVNINSPNNQILITYNNFSSRTINGKIEYSESQQVNVLVIVMAVLGGILLVVLIVAAVCIIRKNRRTQGRVSSQVNLPSETDKLSAREV